MGVAGGSGTELSLRCSGAEIDYNLVANVGIQRVMWSTMQTKLSEIKNT